MIRRSSALVASLLVSLLTACPSDDGGGGGGGGGGGDTYTMSGTMTAAAAQDADTDTGDVNATSVTNDGPDNAQVLPSTVTVGGWVHETADAFDTYAASLGAGQVVTMIPADGGTVNLSLCIAPSDLAWVECGSSAPGIAEQYAVETGGDYFVEVDAEAGAGNYTLVLGQGGASANAVRPGTPFVPGEVLVRFREGAISAQAASGGPTSLATMARSLGLVARAGELRGGPVLLGLPDGDDARAQALGGLGVRPLGPLFASASLEVRMRQETRNLVAALRARPDVASADLNYVFTPSAVPNDPYYGLQWHYPLIKLPQAWDITTGARTGGGDVVVAVVDTGILTGHPDLDGQTFPGYDFISSATISNDGDGADPDPFDVGDSTGGSPSSFHGTHVAGTVAAKSNDGAGVAGVSWAAKILPVRVLGKGGGTSFDIVQGVRWAAGLLGSPANAHKADVINLSLGCLNCFSQTEQDVYNEVRAAGVIVVAAAGNENSTLNGYPASYANVVSVAAVDTQKAKAPYSNFNAAVDIAAPGGDTSVDRNADGYVDGVLSTLAEQDATGAPTTANWTFYQGTSMASPHMAGVVALMKAVCTTLTPAQLDTLISTGAITDEAGTPGKDNSFGYGLVNALKAVQAAQTQCGAAPTEAGLGVDPTTIDFGAGAVGATTNRTLNVSKIGTGTLANVTASVSAGAAGWLSIGSVAAPGLGAYTATANRTGLPAGAYSGQITFTAGAKSVTVDVTMRVGAAAPTTGDVGYLYLLALDPETGEPLGQVDGAGANGTYSWQFTEVPEGEYLLVAGTDADNDGAICDAGEACGAWPTLGVPTPVSVAGNVSDLDFTVSFDAGLGLQAAGAGWRPAEGFRLPRAGVKVIAGGVK